MNCEAQAKVLRRPNRPGDGGYVVCALLPDHTAKIDAISRDEWSDLSNPHGMYHVATEGKPHYIVTTYNATETKLSGLRVYFGKFEVNGSSEIHANSTDRSAGWGGFSHGLPYDITEQARITWQSTDGKGHSVVIDLKSKLPEKLDWQCIVFVIEGDDTVRLTTVPWSKQERWWLNHKP
jgi:hypothetical protein